MKKQGWNNIIKMTKIFYYNNKEQFISKIYRYNDDGNL